MRRFRKTRSKSHVPPSNTDEEEGSLCRMRIAIFGHGNVGKTSLVKRYLYNTFEETYNETIEDIYRKDVISNNQIVDLTILDTAGNYQFPAMRKLAIQHSDGFILAYSIDNTVSFEEVKRLRDIIVEEKGTSDIPIFLVGNKLDAGFRRITPTDVCVAVHSWGKKVEHVEASAKHDIHVDVVFNSLIRMIDERNQEIIEVNKLRVMNRTPFNNMRASFRHSARKLSPLARRKQRSVSVGNLPLGELAFDLLVDPHSEFRSHKKSTLSVL